MTHYGAHHDDVDMMQLTAAYHIISSDLLPHNLKTLAFERHLADGRRPQGIKFNADILLNITMNSRFSFRTELKLRGRK